MVFLLAALFSSSGFLLCSTLSWISSALIRPMCGMEISFHHALRIYILQWFCCLAAKLLIVFPICYYFSLMLRTFLGFGANLLGISVVVVLAVTTRGNPSIMNLKLTVVEKAFLYVISAVGACLSFYFIFFLLEGSFNGYQAEYHEWLYTFSRLLSWVSRDAYL
ncbi:hypothetical protein KSP39_PZI021863 [Platanthera zijinensis]|uniref:Uncharacterized protein n=1 Tax=Platanthera zijinensis TaxID=2320716 RepID=A0AAP0AXC2_9ASPA